MFNRLKNDFQLSILCLMSLFAVVGIAPYAWFRLIEGNWLVGIADTTMVIGTLLAVLYAWRTGDTVKPGIVLATTVSLGVTMVALNLGINGLFWIYVVILFNFFMVSPGKAIVLILLVLTTVLSYALLIQDRVFASPYQMLSFLVTSLIASAFASIFAFRMRSQRDQLQQLAALDPLTGAGNRRAMDSELITALANHRRYATPCGVLLMDLDYFKRLNDQFGHPAGDRLLVDFVTLVKTLVRQNDRLFRFGGEEFLLLMPNTSLDGLEAAAKKLQDKLASAHLGPGDGLTVSMGGALLRPDEAVEAWLKRADVQLYQAKDAGRDRALIDRSPAQPT